MEELVKRNFMALSEGLKSQRTKDSDQDKRIVTIETQLAEIRQELASLTQRFNILFAKSMGNGPTT